MTPPFEDCMSDVLMHGPAFDDSGQLVERNVPEKDVSAFKAAGYVLGGLPSEIEEVEAAAQEVTKEDKPAKYHKKQYRK